MLAAVCCCAMFVLAAEPVDHRLYMSIAGEKRVAMWEADARGGVTHAADCELLGEPGALALRPDGKLLAAAWRAEGKLSSLRVEPKTGLLTLLNVVDAGDDPAHISFDPSGRYLLTAYYRAAKVTVHAFDEQQRLAARPHQSIATAEKAHAILIDPAGRFAFVPHTGPNAIFQFRWDAERAQLSSNEPLKLETPKGTGPRHIVFHPKLPVVYINNEAGSSVTRYALDAKRGTLSAQETATTLPADYKGQNATAELRLHPSGRWLYCANRGHDSLARLEVDARTGALTYRGTTATEKTPRSFDLSPCGNFLYAAGEASGKLACYRVSAESGELELLHTIAVGRTPWWVLAVQK